jgi:hypothetical protein
MSQPLVVKTESNPSKGVGIRYRRNAKLLTRQQSW